MESKKEIKKLTARFQISIAVVIGLYFVGRILVFVILNK